MWEVVMRPTDRGVVVGVWDGSTFSTVGRVQFNRLDPSLPRWRTFKWALRQAVVRAEVEAARLNGPLS